MRKAIFLFMGLAFVLSIDNPNLADSFKSYKPSYYSMLLDKLSDAGKSVKQHFDGFIFLISALQNLYKGKKRVKHLEEIEEDEEDVEPYPKSDLTTRRMLEDTILPYYGPETYAGILNKYYSEMQKKYIYYVAEEGSMAKFTQFIEGLVYLPEDIEHCEHNGTFREVTYLSYACNNQLVTKKNYEKLSLDPMNMCNKTATPGSICSCPRDYYGKSCEFSVPFFCNHRWIKPTIDKLLCNASDINNIEYYDNSRYGLPPCIYVDESRKYSFELALECTTHPIGTEGVKNAQDYLAEPFIVKEKFSYWVNSTNLSLSEPTNVVSALTFLNFNHITDIRQFTHDTTTKEEVIGKKTFQFEVDFREMAELQFGGRWYFELIGAGEGRHLMPGYVLRAVIDDATYVEPTKTKGILWLKLLLIVGGIVLSTGLIVIVVTYYMRVKKKEKEFLTS